jgi:hypothetical protein
MTESDTKQPFDVAGDVSVEEGVVLVDGPDGVAISLTPSAARMLGERLIAAADRAKDQREG